MPLNPATATLHELFALCEHAQASDIHISAGQRPRIRTQGTLSEVETLPQLPQDTVHAIGLSLIAATLHERLDPGALLYEKGAVDGAVSSPAGKRYRFNVFREQGLTAIAMRRLDDSFRSLAHLGLPEQLERFCTMRDGLVIVTGPTGAGKSTTLATLIDIINRTRRTHIVTIEDPVEYVHASQQSLVHQRQVGRDATSFNAALVDSLRQDPDVILVGEIRELDTIRTAITAAETGHLVFTTLHAGDTVGAVERLVSVFPAGEQESIRRQLALVLRGIFAQHLVPAIDDAELETPENSALRTPHSELRGGAAAARVACGELLFVTPAIANLIAGGRSQQIYSALETGRALGMITLDSDLMRLYNEGRISEQTVLAMMRNPGTFHDRVQPYAATRRPRK